MCLQMELAVVGGTEEVAKLVAERKAAFESSSKSKSDTSILGSSMLTSPFREGNVAYPRTNDIENIRYVYEE